MNFSNTNLNLYQTFVLVYETKNLAAAAEILNVTRSAVGQKIKELGNQLGVTLFTPHRKGVIATAEARALYPVIKNSMEAIAEVEHGLMAFDGDSIGIIKIAVSNTHVMMYVKDYMKEFCALYPKVVFEFFGLESVDLLEKGEIDFIIDDDLFFKGLNYNTINLFEANSAFIATKEFLRRHNIGETITAKDLARFPIISLRPPSFGQHINSHIKTVSLDMTYQMVKSSLGIGYFCKELLENIADSETVAVKIADIAPQKIQVVCGYNKTLSKPARAFVEGLQEFCKKRYGN